MAKKDKEKNEPTETTTEETPPVEGLSDEDVKALAVIEKGLPPEAATKLRSLVSKLDRDKPGFEEMDGARMSLPFVKVHQAMSTDMPANSQLGNLYTDTGDVLDKPFEFVPIYMHYRHARFREENSNPDCWSEDGKVSLHGDSCKDCPDLPFRDGQKTDCQRSINVYAFDKGFNDLYRISFSKTSYKAGAKLYKQASASPVPWERIFALTTEERQRQEGPGKYFVLQVTPTGEKLDQKFHPSAKFLYEKISAVRKAMRESLADRADVGKRVVDELPADLGASASDAEPAAKKTEPDLTDM